MGIRRAGVVAGTVVWFAAIGVVADERPAPELTEADCRTLLMLHSAMLDQGPDADAAARAAVEEAIIDRPGCGETEGALLDARGADGASPFDAREPAGFGVQDDAGDEQ